MLIRLNWILKKCYEVGITILILHIRKAELRVVRWLSQGHKAYVGVEQWMRTGQLVFPHCSPDLGCAWSLVCGPQWRLLRDWLRQREAWAKSPSSTGMTPSCAHILHRAGQSSPHTPSSSGAWGGGGLPWQRLGLGLQERLRKMGGREQQREKASKQAGGGKYRNRGRDKHWKGLRNPGRWRQGRGKREGRTENRAEVRQKMEGRGKRTCTGDQGEACRDHVFRSLFFPCSSGAPGFLCWVGSSSVWQIAAPHLLSGQKVTCIPLRCNVSSQAEKTCSGYVALWWQSWIGTHSSYPALQGPTAPREVFAGNHFLQVRAVSHETSFLVPRPGTK